MGSFHPSEAFSWGQRTFAVDMVVPSHDPAVGKFPHLFVPVDTDPDPVVEGEVVPVKRGPGRPRKVKTVL